MMIPPPTPKSALKNPAASPIRIRRKPPMLSTVSVAAALLEPFVSSPERTGIFLDFDGVLAPIVLHAEDAEIPAETRAELERLVARYELVSVV
jgi:hypothetical protein